MVKISVFFPQTPTSFGISMVAASHRVCNVILCMKARLLCQRGTRSQIYKNSQTRMHATSHNTQTQQRHMIWSIFARFLFFLLRCSRCKHTRGNDPCGRIGKGGRLAGASQRKTHTHVMKCTNTHIRTHTRYQTHKHMKTNTHLHMGSSTSKAHILDVLCVTSLSYCKGDAGVEGKV